MAVAKKRIECLIVGSDDNELQQRFLRELIGMDSFTLEYTSTKLEDITIENADKENDNYLIRYENTIGQVEYARNFNFILQEGHDVIVMLFSSQDPNSATVCQQALQNIKKHNPKAKRIWANIDTLNESDYVRFHGTVINACLDCQVEVSRTSLMEEGIQQTRLIANRIVPNNILVDAETLFYNAYRSVGVTMWQSYQRFLRFTGLDAGSNGQGFAANHGGPSCSKR